MKNSIPNESQKILVSARDDIVRQWLEYDIPKGIFQKYSIDTDEFRDDYANGVFDYFMDVISGKAVVGQCPRMQSFLVFLKSNKITTDDLFMICAHLRRSIIESSYDLDINSKEFFSAVSYVCDNNFAGVLKFYTETILKKEIEVDKNSKLLSEYKKALDESALISKTDLNGHMTYVNEKLEDLCGYGTSELIGAKHNIMKHQDMSNEYFENLWRELKQNDIFKGTIKNRKKNGDYFYIDVTIVKISDPFDELTEYMSIAYDVTKLIDARVEALNASKAKEYFLSNMSHEIRTPLNAILGFVNLLIDENISKKHRNYLNIIQSSGENLLSIINDILDFSKLRSGEFNIEPKTFSIHEEITHTMELFVASANAKNITITSFIDPAIPAELYADALRIKQILSNFLGNAIKFTNEGGVISVEASCEEDILKIRVKDNGIGISKSDLNNIFTAFAQAQHSENKKIDGTGLGLSICHQLAEHMHGSVTANSALGKGSTFWLKIPVKINNASCKIYDDLQKLKDLRIVVYSNSELSRQKHEAFIKYANVFGMDTQIVDNLDVDFDIAIIIHDDIDEKMKNEILESDKKYIILKSQLSDEYDKHEHIMLICFPLYCSKIMAAFSELLHPHSYYHQSAKKTKKFKGHILVAEDNEANQELIKILLTKYGLTFDIVYNGYDAVEQYKQTNYDLILMDEQMPVMNGNEAVNQIIEYENLRGLRHTPVSALTANVIKGVEERGLLTGYDAFLGKPIIVKDLERVFKNYLTEVSVDIPKLEQLESVQDSSIRGLDVEQLKEELMLTEDELGMLVALFLKKMTVTLPELKNAIEIKDYKEIGKIAHSIKGASGNFRIEFVQNSASEMEKMAKHENSEYHYLEIFEEIKDRIDEIIISS